MNQQGAARSHEDDWWRQLYGGEGAGEGAPAPGTVGDAGPSDAVDTLDERVASALRALGAPRRGGTTRQKPPTPTPTPPPSSGAAEPPPRKPQGRTAPSPPEPSPPIPLRSTGPGTRGTSTGRPSRDRPSAPGPSADGPSAPNRRAADGPSSDRRAPDSPPPRGPSAARPSAPGVSADRPSADRSSTDRPSAPGPSAARPSAPNRRAADRPSPDHPSTPAPSPDRRAADLPPVNRRSTPPDPHDTPPPTAATPAPAHSPSPGAEPVKPAGSAQPAEPGELPEADPAVLDDPVPDTTLDGSCYGALTLRAASQRGDAARVRGEVRRDALLTTRFGAGRHALILVAVATGRPSAGGAHRAARDARDACTWIGGAIGRSYTRLAEDIKAERRDALKSGLQRLTDRSYGKLRGRAPERDAPAERPRDAPAGWQPAALRCLLVPADPDCRTRVFFGVGAGGLFLLRDGAWQDLEPAVTDHTAGRTAGGGTGLPRPAQEPAHDPYPSAEGPERSEPFLFRTAFARPGDTLLLCSAGLADPLRDGPALAARLADRWSTAEPPGLVDFLAASQLRAEGHAMDRTAVGVWES